MNISSKTMNRSHILLEHPIMGRTGKNVTSNIVFFFFYFFLYYNLKTMAVHMISLISKLPIPNWPFWHTWSVYNI